MYIICPLSLFNIVRSFPTNKRATIQYDGSISDSFEIKRGVKQGCVLAPTLFGIFFSMLLKCTFGFLAIRIKLHTRTDCSLFNLASVRTKKKVNYFTVRDLFCWWCCTLSSFCSKSKDITEYFSSACLNFAIYIHLKKPKLCKQKEFDYSVSLFN